MCPSISVIIPSRLAPVSGDNPSRLWLHDAITSVQQQTIWGQMAIEIVVGIDHDTLAPEGFSNAGYPLQFVPAPSNSSGQAAAVNAAVERSRGQYLAFLEDDDRWHPNFLTHALREIAEFDFVSSNQLELPPDGSEPRFFDFPTPAGWFMRKQLWEEIGGFDTGYRYHFDNDWLGRVRGAGKRRVHLVEAGAPREFEEMRASRPSLYEVTSSGASLCHCESVPLVTRTENPCGGMISIRTSPDAASRSRQEYARLTDIYGRIPS